MTRATALILVMILLTGCATVRGERDALRQQVTAAESAFAAAMAARDFTAFSAFIADDAVFFSGETPLQGRDAVLAHWRRYFDGATAPFSWHPETVVVLESGTLALSSGPVHAADGKLIARFQSTWRRESPGVWRVVFDKGSAACP